jgi:ABC-type Fe3+ transport system substrate-binding protein
LGHERGGKSYPAWQHMLGSLAKKGYVALAWDPLGQGERAQMYDEDFQQRKLIRSTTEHSVLGVQCLITGDNVAQYTIWDGATADVPRSMKDLLDPKWKGKMSIAGTTTGTQWIGAVIETFGMEFLEKLAAQEINVQNISGAALAQLVASGEVPLSPTIFNSNISVAKKNGAPVEWKPIDPVIGASGMSGLVAKAPHPHAGLLFLDFLHSKEGQQAVIKGGLSTARNDVNDAAMKFKKFYIEGKYPPEVLEKKFTEWEGLKRKLFISKR